MRTKFNRSHVNVELIQAGSLEVERMTSHLPTARYPMFLSCRKSWKSLVSVIFCDFYPIDLKHNLTYASHNNFSGNLSIGLTTAYNRLSPISLDHLTQPSRST